LPTQNYQLTIGKVKDFEKSGNRLGAILALTYRNSQTISSDVKRDYYDYHYNDNVYKFSTNVGALFNLGYTFGKNKITFKNVYNRMYDDQFLGHVQVAIQVQELMLNILPLTDAESIVKVNT
jgi:hypothetical protein